MSEHKLQRHPCRRPTTFRWRATISLAALLIGAGSANIQGAGRLSEIAMSYVADGVAPALRLDGSDRPHVAFLDATGVAVANLDGGGWHVRQLPAIAAADAVDLALDAAGHAYVGIVGRSPTAGIWYATDRSGSWSVSKIAKGTASGISIAADALGEVHLATAGASGVLYLTDRHGYWTSHKVSSSSSDGDPSIGLDTTNHVHLAWLRSGLHSPGTWYAGTASGAWKASRLDAAGSAPALAVAADGSTRIAYATTQGVRLMSDASGSWVKTPVTSGPYDGYVRLLLGAGDKPTIGYYHSRDTEAGRGFDVGTLSGGTWTTRHLLYDFSRPALALASDGSARLAIDGVLYGREGDTVHNTAVTAAASDRDVDLQIGGGSQHVVFNRDGANPGVYYGYDDGSGWSSSLVSANLPHIGRVAPSLALDAQNHVHVAYVGADGAEDRLFHAVLGPGGWTSEIVDATGEARCPALVIDPGGTLHVAYQRITHPSPGFNVYGLGYMVDSGSGWVDGGAPSQDDPGCPTLATDAAGHASLVYKYGGSPAYVTNSGGSWTHKDLGLPDTHLFGIAVAGNGDVLIAHVDDRALGVRRLHGGAWSADRVQAPQTDDVELVRRGPDMAIGMAHGYSKPVNGVWRYVSVDSDTPDMGSPTDDAIALDASGRPLIVYRATAGGLRRIAP